MPGLLQCSCQQKAYTRILLTAVLLSLALLRVSLSSDKEGVQMLVADAPGEAPSRLEWRRSQQVKLRVRVRPSAKATKPQQQLLSAEEVRALMEPISVAIMTAHYFGGDYGRTVEGCELQGVPLNCTFFPKGSDPFLANLSEESRKADAVWYHAPNTCTLASGPWGSPPNATYSPFKARPDQIAVIASMESSAYYRCLDDEAFMSNFDVEMTYRRKAEVPLLYWGKGYKETWEKLPPVPVAEKQDAVVFINSNCQPPSGRTEIVAALRATPGVRVDALGTCLNEGGRALERGAGNKFDSFRRYKYCIAMENSIAADYVTEKVYDALAAGCVPIYLGAPNIADFVPTNSSIIDYNAFGSAEALAEELRRLSANDTAYIEKLAWRTQPETWSDSFQALLKGSEPHVHSQCRLCQLIARHKANMTSFDTSRPRVYAMPRPFNSSGLLPYHVKNFKIQYKLADAPPASMEDVLTG